MDVDLDLVRFIATTHSRSEIQSEELKIYHVNLHIDTELKI